MKKVRDKKEETKEKKVRVKQRKTPRKSTRLHSMQTKVRALVILGVVASVAATILIMITYVKGLVIDSAYGKMLNMATSYGKLIDKAEEEIYDGIRQNSLSTEQFTEILAGMEITGLEDFSYFVVDQSGIIRYHADESKIGKPNKIKVITDVVAAIAKGNIPDNLCMECEDDGERMYASYYVTENKSLMIICAPHSELMRPIIEMALMAGVIALIVLLVIVVISTLSLPTLTPIL